MASYLIKLKALLILILTVKHCQSSTKEQKRWVEIAVKDLEAALKNKPIVKKAKNVIFFLGDGMSLTTLTTSRIYKGQLKKEYALDGYLTFERFPNLGLVKTYNVDKQVPDSAATATAYLNGVKANMGTIGVDSNVKFKNCSSFSWLYETQSIFVEALMENKKVGFVTTARITHASPAGLYAHTPDRNWEYDKPRNKDVIPNLRHNCLDISQQFLKYAADYKVVFGGGRGTFLPGDSIDPEYPHMRGKRTDGKDLIAEWKWKQKKQNRKPKFIWNKGQFDKINPQNDEHILGLFEPSHMQYDLLRNSSRLGEPSIAEMTRKSIEILSHDSPNGYFLFVEGGRIDHGHHDNIAKLALTDTLAFEKAIDEAVSMTDIEDTLILVTSDHSHVFTFGAYPSANIGIFDVTDDNAVGKGPGIAKDGKPYTSLAYANGPSAPIKGSRPSILSDDLNANKYTQQSIVPLDYETHGGDDVGVFARGPMSHLFHRVHEQHYIAHVVRYASCIGEYSGKKCLTDSSSGVSSKRNSSNVLTLLTMVVFLLTYYFITIS